MEYAQQSVDSDNYDYDDDHNSDEDAALADDFDNVGRGSGFRNSGYVQNSGSKNSVKRVENHHNHGDCPASSSSADKRALRPKSARYGCRPNSKLVAHEASCDDMSMSKAAATVITSAPSTKRTGRKCTVEASPSITSGPTTVYGASDVRSMATEYLDDVVHSGSMAARSQSRGTSPDNSGACHGKKTTSSSGVSCRMRNGIPPVPRQGRQMQHHQQQYQSSQYGQQPQTSSHYHYQHHQGEMTQELDDTGEDMVLYSRRQEEGDQRVLYETVLNATGQKVLDKLKDRQRVLSNFPSTGSSSIGISGSDSSKSGQYGSRKLQPLLATKIGYRHN